MEETDKTQHKLPNQEIDYLKIAKILISRWYWIAGSVAVCMMIANVYLWYTPKIFATAGTMKFEDKKSEIADLSIVGTPEKGPSRIQTETSVMQSHGVIVSAIKDLDYRTSFYVVGRLINRTNELYPVKPIDIEFLKFDTLDFFRGLVTFTPLSKSVFSLSYMNGSKKLEKIYGYNATVTLGPTSIRIKNSPTLVKNSVYLFKFNSPEDFTGRVRGGLRTSEIIKNSNIISVQQIDQNPQFAADILNAIMTEYLIYDRVQRMQSATQMIDFIDSQIKYLSGKVETSEKSIEKYKQNLKVVDVNSAADAAIARIKDVETQISGLRLQLIAVDQLKSDVVKEKENASVSFDLEGVSDAQLQTSLLKLDNLLILKNNKLKSLNADSRPIVEINQQILQLKNAAITNIDLIHKLVERNLKFLGDQLVPLNQQIAKYPAAENDMAGLKRNFDVNDKVYSFLSEKKLNAQITRSGILPGATIIDRAQANFSPISPNEYDIKRTAMIFGIAIGFALIILIRILNPYIYDKETIESLTSIPIIGVIRKYPEEIDEFSSQIMVISKPKSVFAESVRSVRTNLNFLASEKKSKVICCTSEVAGEGKSFVAVNLSTTLSLIEKKVIFVAADLRRSKIHKTFNVPNDLGLSNYLANQCEIEDIIVKTSQPNLDFVISGPVPPNPSELLHSERMKTLIAVLREKYDIIMIDTAPIGLVSDAIPLIRLSDINIFVIRSGKSKFYAATVPQRIAQEYHLDNTVIVLNAYAEDLLHSRYYTTKFTGENYGARYYYYSDYSGYESSGYYVDNKKHKWWNIRRWFKK
jgi:tyrosine-protein kinase Etk/Wzc